MTALIGLLGTFPPPSQALICLHQLGDLPELLGIVEVILGRMEGYVTEARQYSFATPDQVVRDLHETEGMLTLACGLVELMPPKEVLKR